MLAMRMLSAVVNLVQAVLSTVKAVLKADGVAATVNIGKPLLVGHLNVCCA